MEAAAYDAWYQSARGAWIGDIEYRLLNRMLRPQPGATLLDVGCGTGYFTRRFARDAGLRVTGVDPNFDWLNYARAHSRANEVYVAGNALDVPFADASIDFTISVTALCFIKDQQRALKEIIRVARRGFALGLLNRHSLLYRQKGKEGGSGAYKGARWHTVREVHELLSSVAMSGASVRTAVFLPSAGMIGRAVEPFAPSVLPWGAFIAVAGQTNALNLAIP